MNIRSIRPAEAKRLIEQEGAMLVDIREAGEHARENIPGAKLAPLSEFADAFPAAEAADRPVIFHCAGGTRTLNSAAMLQGSAAGQVYLLEGGLAAWKQAGLPTQAG